MEFKSLFLGILFSVGIFSIKAGIGLHYRVNRNKMNNSNLKQINHPSVNQIRSPGLNQFDNHNRNNDMTTTRQSTPAWFIYLGFIVLYAILFAVIGSSVAYMDMLADFENIQKFLQNGMVIHLGLSALMLLWGIGLLKSHTSVRNMSSGWLILVFPCPVCMTVIGISVAFIFALFPDTAAGSILLFYLAFMFLSFLTAAFMEKFQRWSHKSPEFILGYAMATIASYLLLSIVIMPQFSGLDEVYRLATNSAINHQSIQNSLWLAAIPGVFLFTIGYLKMKGHINRYLSQISNGDFND